MQKKEIKIKDLLTMMDNMSITYGHVKIDYSDEYLKPVVKLVYNHLIDMSAKELNEIKLGRQQNLYNYLIAKNQPLLFSILMEKGAFKEQYNPELIKLKQQLKPLGLSNEFHAFVFLHESSRERTNDKDFSTFANDVVRYLAKEPDINKRMITMDYMLSNPTKANKFIKESIDVGIRHAKSIKSKECINFLNEIIQEAAKKDIDVLKQNENYLNNKYLNPVHMNDRFFISTLNQDEIELLVNEGFKFNNKDYEFGGKSLISNIVETGRAEWIPLIIPAVNTIKCAEELRAKQDYEVLNMNDRGGKFTEIKSWYAKEVKKEEIKEMMIEMDKRDANNPNPKKETGIKAKI